MLRSPSKLMLSHIAHKERVVSLQPEFVLGLERQHHATPYRNRGWTRAWELSMAQALRKRMKIMRSLRSSG
jgi:hypothetical protein